MPRRSKNTQKNFSEFLNKESATTGKTKDQIVEEIFNQGWISVQETVQISESLSSPNQAPPLMTAWKGPELTDNIDELRRLRKEFTPIAKGVDYIKSNILGNNLDVLIDDPKDTGKLDSKKEIQNLMKSVFQDCYTISLYTILNIMLDETLTVGAMGAEIRYETPVKFNTYVVSTDKGKLPTTSNDKGGQDFYFFKTKEPDWKDLKSIVQLKIIKNAIGRFKLYRDPETWDANYWTLDEIVSTGDTAMNVQQLTQQKLSGMTIRYHPWQVFWLAVNRREFDERGVSVIEPVRKTALILERIIQSVGEGIYRAGNKKYFIVTGAPERQWSKPMIRNVMQSFQEMGKRNWTAIPVPSGFDIKDIGGNVFEATNVINTLMILIAEGMHVPADVLGFVNNQGTVGGTQQLTTSFNEIEQMRYEFRQAIENQLFKRQLWILHGKTKTKQGGSVEPIYVPSLKISTKGLLSPLDRLEQIKSLLNVANPVIPELKLNLEKDLAEVLGYDDIQFQTQEELSKQLKKEQELQEQTDTLKVEQLRVAVKNAKNPLLQKPAGGGGFPAQAKIGGDKKEEGQPDPASKDKQMKRLAGGVSGKKVGTDTGKSKPLGSTRKALKGKKKVGEVLEEINEVDESDDSDENEEPIEEESISQVIPEELPKVEEQ
jgi:hypothetical protein